MLVLKIKRQKGREGEKKRERWEEGKKRERERESIFLGHKGFLFIF